MMRISSRAKVATGTSLIACFVAIGAVVGVWYFTEHNKKRLDDIEQTIFRMEREAEQYTALELLLADTTDARAELETYILTDSDVINFLSLLEQVAVDAGALATTKTISTVAMGEGTVFESLVVELEVNGPFDAVRTTINLYEHLPYQTRIESASLGTAADGSDSWNSTVRLTATKFKP